MTRMSPTSTTRDGITRPRCPGTRLGVVTSNAARAMGRRGGGIRSVLRIPGRQRASSPFREPTSRSSRSRDAAREVEPDRRAPA